MARRQRGVTAFTLRWYRRLMWVRRVVVLVSAIAGVVAMLRRFSPPGRALPPGRADGGPGGVGAPRPDQPRSPSGSMARTVPVSEDEADTVVARTASVLVSEARWVEPVGGICPEGYPIKANAKSMIYHSPGGQFYARTHADRCYVDGIAAEADGFRAAKS